MQKFDFIRRKSVEIFKKYGYQEVLSNILEHEELFQRSLGEASEIIQKVNQSNTHYLNHQKGNV